jgi:hypothetical protein
MASRSRRNHNPGNLRFSIWTQRRGAYRDRDGYAIFKTHVQGAAVLAELLATPKYRKLSIRAAFARYAPGCDDNDPEKFADFVAAEIDEEPETVIETITPFQFYELLEAVTIFEGWKP